MSRPSPGQLQVDYVSSFRRGAQLDFAAHLGRRNGRKPLVDAHGTDAASGRAALTAQALFVVPREHLT